MSIEADIIEEAKKVETAVEDAVKPLASEAKKLVIELTAEEKLAVRDVEVGYLRMVSDATRIQQEMEKAKQRYQQLLAQYTVKYAIDPAEHAWSELTADFRAVAKKL
jgi:uncharacterized protein YpuA (DUF1002 family)